MNTGLGIGASYTLEFTHPDGRAETVVVKNLVPQSGLEHVLSTLFVSNEATDPLWYLGLLGAGYTNIATKTLADAATHQIETYTPADRVPWAPDPLATPWAALSNSGSPAEFTFTAGAVIQYVMLTNVQPHAVTTGVLLSVASVGTAITVVTGSVLRVTGSFNVASL